MIKKLIIGFCILMFLLPSVLACEEVSVTYFGECPYSGDLEVLDLQANQIAKEFFSIDAGCYEGHYTIEVQGGVEDDCILQNEETVIFLLNDNVVGEVEFSVYDKVRNVDLKEKESLSPEILIVLALLVAFVIYYFICGDKKKTKKPRKSKRRKKRRKSKLLGILIGLIFIPVAYAICEESVVYYGNCLPNGDLIVSNLNNSQVLINQAHGPFSGCDNGFYVVELGSAGPGCAIEPGHTILFEVKDQYGIQSSQTEWKGNTYVVNHDLISKLLYRVEVNFNDNKKFKVNDNVFCKANVYDFEGDEISKVRFTVKGPGTALYEKEFNSNECTVRDVNDLTCSYSIPSASGRKGMWNCEVKYWDVTQKEYASNGDLELVNSIPLINVNGLQPSYDIGNAVQFGVSIDEQNPEDNVFVKLNYPYSNYYDSTSGDFAWQTTPSDEGTHTIIVSADDGAQTSVENLFLTINDPSTSMPPPPPPPSGGGGGGTVSNGTVGGGTGGTGATGGTGGTGGDDDEEEFEEEEEELVNQSAICIDEWECGEWSPCVNNIQRRECNNVAACLIGRHDYVQRNRKLEEQECISEVIPEPVELTIPVFEEEEPVAAPAEVKEVKEGMNAWPWILLIVLLGIIGGVGYYLLQRGVIEMPISKPKLRPVKPLERKLTMPRVPAKPVAPVKSKVSPIKKVEQVSAAKIKIYGLVEDAYRKIGRGNKTGAKSVLHKIAGLYKNLPKKDKKEIYSQYMKLYNDLK